MTRNYVLKYLLLRKESCYGPKIFTTFPHPLIIYSSHLAPTITQLKCNSEIVRFNPKKGNSVGAKKFPRLIPFTQMKAILCLWTCSLEKRPATNKKHSPNCLHPLMYSTHLGPIMTQMKRQFCMYRLTLKIWAMLGTKKILQPFHFHSCIHIKTLQFFHTHSCIHLT